MNKNLNVSFMIVAFAALLWFVAGCASASTPTPTPASPLVGTWVFTVTEEDALVINGKKSGMGQYEATITDNGRVSMLLVGVGVTGEGSYTLTQDKLVVTEENTSCVAAGFPTSTYSWSIENDSLTFTVIDDKCYTRRKIFEGRTMTRKKTFGTPVPTIKPLLK